MKVVKIVLVLVAFLVNGKIAMFAQIKCNDKQLTSKSLKENESKFITIPFLHLPVEGTYGETFKIVNYVDWAEGNEILDHNCGNKTYNGHQGTDFVIRSFRTMDSGVSVTAAADGIVTTIIDGLFDREKVSDISKGFGNYIAIQHFNGFTSYYAHLVTNSIDVQIGDTVKAGQRIALVGSSGNSSDPHLHFELWNDSVGLVDPFKGSCGNAQSLWFATPDYDTSFHLWTSGLTDFIPDLDTLREEPPLKNQFKISDESITYWAILNGIRKGDSLSINWYTPDESLWFRFSFEAINDAWYYYYWSYINVPTINTFGEWKTRMYRNEILVDERTFTIEDATSADEKFYDKFVTVRPNPFYSFTEIKWFTSNAGITILEIVDVFGKPIKTLVNEFKQQGEHYVNFDSKELPSGVYLYSLKIDNKVTLGKLLLLK